MLLKRELGRTTHAVYSLFAVNRDKITEVSKQVFTGYLGDVSTVERCVKIKLEILI